MRVLLVMATGDGTFGGMEKHSLELAGGLASQGVEVSLACDARYHDRLPTGVVGLAIPAAASRRNPRLLWRLRRLIVQGQFHLVHGQGNKAAQLLKTLAGVTRGPRYLATLHNYKSHYPGPAPFAAVIAVSQALGQAIGFPHVRVIYNGIAPPCPRPSDNVHPIDGPAPRWLAVGRLVPAKGFDVLIQAFSSVEGSLWIAGEGPERPRLKSLIQQTGQQQRIHLLGHCDHVQGLMAQADRLVISSRREGFSYVFAEAMLSGLPLVATDVPVANEFLPRELICPTDNVEALTRNMAGLDQQLALLDTPRKRATAELTLEAMTNRTLALYREVLAP